MTSYTNHPDSIFDLGAPILGSTHLEARDNLIAMAEGDPTAPKINGLALEGLYVAFLSRTNSTSPIGVNDLGDFNQITLSGSWRKQGAYGPQIRFSSDNGASFGGWSDLLVSDATIGTLVIDKSLQSQSLGGLSIANDGSPSRSPTSGSLTIPSGADAFQLRASFAFQNAWFAVHVAVTGGKS